MKLIWKWCSFEKDRTIIWIKIRGRYYQFSAYYDIFFHRAVYTERTLPHIINI